MPSIFYMLPGSSNPNGGAYVLLDHVEALRKCGFSAYAVAPRGFKLWRATSAQIIDGSSEWSCPDGSILVYPEVVSADTLAISKHRDDLIKLIYCQSYRGISNNKDILGNLNSYGISGIFSNAPFVSLALSKIVGIADAPVVSCKIDTGLFCPGKKNFDVAYMTNKLPNGRRNIEFLLHENNKNVSWAEISMNTREEVAHRLSESFIFLTLGYREGFGLPPLEAMAAGCLVVGFHAEGAKAYATASNGFWHGENDYAGVTDSLMKALDLCRRGDTEYHSRIEAGFQTARSYSPERMERELLGYFVTFLVRNGRLISDFLL